MIIDYLQLGQDLRLIAGLIKDTGAEAWRKDAHTRLTEAARRLAHQQETIALYCHLVRDLHTLIAMGTTTEEHMTRVRALAATLQERHPDIRH